MATYNQKNPAVKRIQQEIKEVQADTSGDFMAEALESDIFEWHFSIRGPPDTEFEGGIYHGRILLPADYPFKPPAFMMLTPSGRFETGVKICLSISAHHPEHWQPSWSIRTALTALVAFMPSPGAGALGSLDYTKEERRKLALKARQDAPRWGSAERQRIIEDMHARMIALTPAAQASTSSAAQATDAATPTPTQPATPAQPAASAEPQPADSTTPLDLRQEAGTIPTAPASTSPASPSTATLAAPSLLPSTTTAPAPASPQTVSAQTATTMSVGAPTSSSSPSPALRARPAAQASTPAVMAPPPRRASTAGAAVAPPPAAAPPDTWALTALAVALGVLIFAIMLRKALVAAGYEVPPLTSSRMFTEDR